MNPFADISCLISMLVLALIGASLREVDWTKENRKNKKS